MVRARVALVDGDASGALTNAWTATEGMLGDLLKRHLDEQADRPVEGFPPGNAPKFVNSNRRDFFESAEMTARNVVELLSLVDWLPFHLYRTARQCATARNKWLHAEEEPSTEVAVAALEAAGELFELLEGVPLRVLPKFGSVY